jgi:Flp pilus assembly protein TadG
MMGAAPVMRRFLVSTRAMAAIEFSLLLPMMLVLLLASIDAGRLVRNFYRRGFD